MISPEILKTFNAAIDAGQLPPSITESIITLILKKGKYPLECGSYRPVSLLCCDGKITKIFALRVNNIIKKIIHQVEFVKGRTQTPLAFNLEDQRYEHTNSCFDTLGASM